MTDKAHRSEATKKQQPTDGPSADDRGTTVEAEHEAALRAAHIQQAHDLHAQVIHMQVKGSGCEIILSAGMSRGVLDGMTGYLAGADGKGAYDFVITDVNDGRATAFVEATPDGVSQHQQAVINPSHK